MRRSVRGCGIRLRSTDPNVRVRRPSPGTPRVRPERTLRPRPALAHAADVELVGLEDEVGAALAVVAQSAQQVLDLGGDGGQRDLPLAAPGSPPVRRPASPGRDVRPAGGVAARPAEPPPRATSRRARPALRSPRCARAGRRGPPPPRLARARASVRHRRLVRRAPPARPPSTPRAPIVALHLLQVHRDVRVDRLPP